MYSLPQGLPIELIREHGVHDAYKNNMCTVYDLNCAFAYQPSSKHYKPISNSWVPDRNFLDNYGPGRRELIRTKQKKWDYENNDTKPSTQYECSYSKINRDG